MADIQVLLDGVDFTSCALEGSVTRRLNRPAQAQIKIPMDCAAGCSGPGERLKISFLVGTTMELYFHGMVMDWELDGGEDTGYITMNAMDPMELWAHRPVRAADGDFSNPEINNLDGATLTGPSMIEAVLNASINPALIPTLAEGPLFLTLGTFAAGGVDLTGAPVDWPMTIAEFVNLLISSGEVDVVITPTDPGGGVMGTVDVYNGNYGTDLSGSVVFEYGTGDKNVRALRWNQDMSNICNKLFYFAGPRIETASDPAGDQHWCFNVQGDDPCFNGGVCASPNAADMEDAFVYAIDPCRDDSRTAYGVRMDIQVFDAASDLCVGPGGVDPGRDLYRWLWLAESWARCNPRTLIHVTPTRGTEIGTFDIGDLVGVTIGSGICGGISGAQRVYQYTIGWTPDGPLELGELQTSSDVGIP